MGIYTALSTLIGFSILSIHAYLLNHGFLCFTSLVCALTGWIAHRNSADTYWNTLDIWMVQSIAVGNFMFAAYMLDYTNQIHIILFILLCIGGIKVAHDFTQLKENNWNEQKHIIQVLIPSFIIISILPYLYEGIL